LKSHVELPYSSPAFKDKNATTAGSIARTRGTANLGSRRSAAEGCQGFLLTVKDLENRCQLGNLQHIAQALA
jgi:hypothetical protein